MAQGDQYIASGALLKCSQTLVPGIIGNFKCVNTAHNINGIAVGTEIDIIPGFNVQPFSSSCKILTAAAAGTPTPCLPFPTPWLGTHAGFISNGRKLLLTSSYSYCVFGGKIALTTAGQTTASLGGQATPSFQTPQEKKADEEADKKADEERKQQTILVCEPGSRTTGWNAELNQVPLVANAKYVVGTDLYETDGEGRVVRVRGVLRLSPHPDPKYRRNEDEQSLSPRLKDGLLNNVKLNPDGTPNRRVYQPDLRDPHQKAKQLKNGQRNGDYKSDDRRSMQRRMYLDEGGHLRAAGLDGAGEQINLISQHMDQNQSRRNNKKNWYQMEKSWMEELRKPKPSHVYTDTRVRYPSTPGSSPSGESARPDKIYVQQWINGEEGPDGIFRQ